MLIDYLKQNGLNVSILSKLTKIPYATLHKGLEQRSVLKAENLARVANQLGLTMDEVFAMLAYGEPGNKLSDKLKAQRDTGSSDSLYRYTQIHFALSSISLSDGSLTQEQITAIFDENSTGGADNVSDIVATANTMSLFDVILDESEIMLSESLLQRYALTLSNTTGARGAMRGNVGIKARAKTQIRELLLWYNALPVVSFQDILQFHALFMRINPLDSSSGALARLITFKECLRTQHVPFIVHEDYKAFYTRGVQMYDSDTTFLSDICLTMQENYVETIKQFLGEDYIKQLVA
jgi:hypothetical protein